MKHLKKSYILLILLTVTVIIGSRIFAKDIFSSLNLFQTNLATANATTTNQVNSRIAKNYIKPRATNNIVLQSTDGGQTWQDISSGLPKIDQPQDFFTGGSDVYLRVRNVMYHSKSNLKTPVWERERGLDLQSTTIAFNHSGVMAYNYKGQIYQKMPDTKTWLPIYENFKTDVSFRYISNPEKNINMLHTVFETSDGTVFAGCHNGLYKSTDKGSTWNRVQDEGLVMDIVESQGVLIGAGQNGIMRSADNGEHWEAVISEGGVGIAVEVIEGGFAAISYSEKAKSRRVRISLDSGKTWQAIDDGLQPSGSISSIKQVGNYLLCGHPDGIFRSSDMGMTWSMVHSAVNNTAADSLLLNMASGDKGKVFKIYVSGNVLYAVARDFGC